MLFAPITSKPTKFTNCKCYVRFCTMSCIHKTSYNICIFQFSSIILYKFRTWIKRGTILFYIQIFELICHILDIMRLAQIVITTILITLIPNTVFTYPRSFILNVEDKNLFVSITLFMWLLKINMSSTYKQIIITYLLHTFEYKHKSKWNNC